MSSKNQRRDEVIKTTNKKMHHKLQIHILCLFIGLLFGLNSCTEKGSNTQVSAVFVDSVLSPKLLNSERIKMKFGSYDIQVLRKNSRLRVSNLYSLNGDKKITRTFAVVRYPEHIDSMFLKEHLKILEGQSIGAVFKQHGWQIEKGSHYFGEIPPSPEYEKIYKLMGHLRPSKLAIYSYGFNIKKDHHRYLYAIISEVYHPDYLTLDDLKSIYQDADDYLDASTFTSLLKEVKQEMTMDDDGLRTNHNN